VPTTAEYLRQITNSVCTPISHPNIPIGWALFTDVRPQRRANVPDGLDALDLDTQVNIICSGGLRVGRRREWLAGAPPNIVITGLERGDEVKVDGIVVMLSQDGIVQRNGHSFEPGIHSIEAGGQRTTFEIVEPQIGNKVPLRPNPVRYVTLPQGQWTLIGAVPGEASGLITAGRQGVIRAPDFDPIWAISVGSGPGALVLSLKIPPRAPHSVVRLRPKREPGAQRWVGVVYEAAIRRPHLNSLFPTESNDQINTIWAAYVRIAKQIKREWRNSR
jgi:hypothetical protein